jgi:hypothetical protein
MELLNSIVSTVALGISRLLEPVMGSLERLDLFLRQQLSAVYVPFQSQGTVITVGWAILLFLVFRALSGAARVIFVLLVAAVLAKIYGVLPPA